MEKVYCVVSTGVTKTGKDSSRLAPIVKLDNGNEFIDFKNTQYVDGKFPLLKQFKMSFN